MFLPTTALSCFFATVLIASHNYKDVSLPFNVNSSIIISVSISNFKCSNIGIGEIYMAYNQSGLYVEALQDTILNCTFDGNINNAGPSVIQFDFGLQKGKTLEITTKPINSSTCMVNNATLVSSALMIYAFNIQTLSGPASPFMNPGFINAIIPGYLVDFYKKFAVMLEDYSPTPDAELPPFVEYSLPVSQWPLGRALKNIVDNLPVVMGLKITLDNPTETAIRINASTAEEVGDPNYNVIDVPTFVRLNTSKHFGLSLTAGASNLVCDQSKFKCVAYRGAGLFNIQSIGAFAKQIPLLDKVIGSLVPTLANKGLGYATESPFPLNVVDVEPVILPPYRIICSILPILVLCACISVMFSFYRHLQHPALSVTTGEPISRWRVLAEDCLLSVSIFSCIFMFVWSNSTDTATAFVAGEINFASFSLVTSVRDLWNAKLRFLSILVMFFSGIYPYFKLVCIGLYCFFLRRPTSRVLIVLDNIGKFSMMDTFMLCILKSSLEVKGFGLFSL